MATRTAALDLSLADGRFSPDVLEVAARRAVAAWAQAIDGDDRRSRSSPTGARSRRCCIPPARAAGSSSAGHGIEWIRITGLDAAAEPPTMTIEVRLDRADAISRTG